MGFARLAKGEAEAENPFSGGDGENRHPIGWSPVGGNSLFVEMMGFEPMSKFVFQKIFYKFSRIVLTNLSSIKPAKP